jgi:hypothetical protein
MWERPVQRGPRARGRRWRCRRPHLHIGLTAVVCQACTRARSMVHTMAPPAMAPATHAHTIDDRSSHLSARTGRACPSSPGLRRTPHPSW